MLRRRNAKLEDQLARHRVALEAQGKASELLAQLLAQSTPETDSSPRKGRRGDRRVLQRGRAAPRHQDRLCRGRNSRASHYRRARPGRVTEHRPRPAPPNKLSDEEVDAVLEVLRSARFADCSPAQVYFSLLDEGVYLASESSYYRILRSQGEVRERRRQATHPAKVKPELVADRPLVGVMGHHQAQGTETRRVPRPLCRARHLQSLRRGVVCGAHESGELAKELIADAVARHQAPPDQITIHADRGSSMTSNPVAELLSFLGIKRSHSRPHVSNDNPFSEAQFKTLKYCPAFPQRFGCIQDARAFCEAFFAYYNHEHRHSGIGYHTPASVHYGTAEEVRSQRAETLDAA